MESKKPAAKPAAAVKAETAKVTETVKPAVEVKKAEPVKEVKAAAKAETKAEPAKKTAAKKTTVKKAEAKTTVKKEETVKEAKEAAKTSISLQFGGKSYTTEDLMKIMKDVWTYDLGKKEAELKDVELYVKPEENAVYYVANGEITGSFGI
ncbi:MAG: hypothetical protein J6B10_04200 [Lachnospiraceae bacterium]|nr:hypothetical protein [Lachnospiraceae bacterium]